MLKNSPTTYLSCCLALSITVSGCATGQKFRGPITIASNSEIIVVSASARQKPDGILAGGDVHRSNGYAGANPGHLHVIGWDGAGNAVATADVPWGEFMSRRFRLAYFKAFLPTNNVAAISKISIEPVNP